MYNCWWTNKRRKWEIFCFRSPTWRQWRNVKTTYNTENQRLPLSVHVQFHSTWDLAFLVADLQRAEEFYIQKFKTYVQSNFFLQCIDLFLNGDQINYSFVLMLISPTNLATTSKFQKNICFKTRAIGLININTKECKVSRHLWKWSIATWRLLWRRFKDPSVWIVTI